MGVPEADGGRRSKSLAVICESSETGQAKITDDPALLADGWERRYLADEDRAREAEQLYSSLGFEVRAQKLDPDQFAAECGECPSVVCKSHVLVYTRRRR